MRFFCSILVLTFFTGLSWCQDSHPAIEILRQNCWDCHGNKTKGGFDLRDPELPDYFWDSLISDDEEERMPKDKSPLTETELAIVKDWLGMADRPHFPEHWAFQKLPDLSSSDQGNLIDRFTSDIELLPSQPWPQLVRRYYLALTGLYPTPEQAAMWHDPAQATALVDHLLSASAYGEHQADWWLDIARYADTNGYSQDKDMHRNVWLYRDWVIGAFNADMPWRDFVRYQIAGDLHAEEHAPAVGFLRNSMDSLEGGSVPEKFRIEQIHDRLRTVGQGLLGLTVHCAQCHDHRFDQISQAEYYQMFALLNQDTEAYVLHPTKEQKQLQNQLKQKVLKQVQLAQSDPKLQMDYLHWTTQREYWHYPEPTKIFSLAGYGFELQDNQEIFAPVGRNGGEVVYEISLDTPVPNITALKLQILPDPGNPYGSLGHCVNGEVSVSLIEVLIKPAGSADSEFEVVRLSSAETSYQGAANQIVDGKKDSHWGYLGNGPMLQRSVDVIVQFANPIHHPIGSEMKVSIHQRMGYKRNIGRFRLGLTAQPPAYQTGVDAVPYELQNHIENTDTSIQVNDNYRDQMWEAFLQRTNVQPYRGEIDKLYTQWPHGNTFLGFANGPVQRNHHMLDQGEWDQPLDQVTPGIPVSLHKGQPNTRLDFADWLASDQNQLTPRVLVNHVWQQVFGTGFSTTPGDLGHSGASPTQLRLFDALAADFAQHGSFKQLIRTIALSKLFQQETRTGKQPTTYEISGFPRFRMRAEEIRDNVLLVPGALNRQIGGPSVMPPIKGTLPMGSWTFPWNTRDHDRYRRALYTYWRRTSPYPFLNVIDAPDATQICVRRERSVSPLHALATLNEEVLDECAYRLAQQVQQQPEKTRLDWLYLKVLGREPNTAERNIWQDYSHSEVTHKEWYLACKVLLNLDEFTHHQ